MLGISGSDRRENTGRSEPQVCILHEILHVVQHQRVGDVVLFGVFRHIALEKAQVEDMDLRIVLHGELGKGVAIGVFNKQKLAALAAALDNGLCLVGVQTQRTGRCRRGTCARKYFLFHTGHCYRKHGGSDADTKR